MNFNDNGRLTDMQIERLLKPIDPSAVEVKRGMSYIAQYEVRAELSRLFGFGNWDSQVESMTLLYETEIKQGDPQFPKAARDANAVYWVTGYSASVRLNIRDYEGNPIASYVEYHAEENAPLPNRGEAHAMAMTSVESYALRRAAINLGDRFGLGLYDKGSVAPLVNGTLQLHERQVERKRQQGSQDARPEQNVAVAVPTGAPAAEALNEARSALQAGMNQA